MIHASDQSYMVIQQCSAVIRFNVLPLTSLIMWDCTLESWWRHSHSGPDIHTKRFGENDSILLFTVSQSDTIYTWGYSMLVDMYRREQFLLFYMYFHLFFEGAWASFQTTVRKKCACCGLGLLDLKRFCRISLKKIPLLMFSPYY